MDRFKKFWHDHKDKIRGAAVGVGVTSAVACYLIVKMKDGRMLTVFEVLSPYNPATQEQGLLYVKHRDGEEGTYFIDS